MKVIALKLGYFGGRLIEPNTIFDVPAGSEARWFESVADDSIDTVAEIKDRLDELGIEYPKHARKAELEEILQSVK